MHINELKGAKTRQNLIEAQPIVERNKRLVTITTDLDLVYHAEACRLRNYDQNKVLPLLNELEFRSLIKDLPQSDTLDVAGTSVEDNPDTGQIALFSVEDSAPPTSVEIINEYLCVQDEAALQQVVAALATAEQISFDVETTSTDAVQATLVGLGVAFARASNHFGPIASYAWIAQEQGFAQFSLSNFEQISRRGNLRTSDFHFSLDFASNSGK